MSHECTSPHDARCFRLRSVPVTLPFLVASFLSYYCPVSVSAVMLGICLCLGIGLAVFCKEHARRDGMVLCISALCGFVWYGICCHLLDTVPDPFAWIDRALHDFRLFLDESLRRNVGGDGGILLSAMLTGVRDTVPQAMKDAFSRLGISHILAISGLHLSVLSGMVGLLLRRIGARRQTVLIVSSAFCVLFCAVCGFPFPLLRATVMYLFFCAAFFLGRDSTPSHSLCHAGALICLFSPAAIGSLSFQMSFSATLGIVLLTRPLTDAITSPFRSRTMRGIASYVGGLASSTFAANLFLLPISCLQFGSFAPASFLVNFLFIPLSALLLYSGIFTLLFGFVPVLGGIAATVSRGIASLFLHLVDTLDASVGRVYPMNTPFGICLCIAVIGLCISYCLIRRKADWGLLLIFVFCCILYGVCAHLSASATA